MAKKNNSKSNQFNLFLYVELISSILFTLLTISFHGDISLLSFPISLIFTGITVYFAYFKFLKPQNGKKAYTVLKLIQYLPFVLFLAFILRRAGKTGTTYAYDVISVILWCVVFVFSLICSTLLNEKRFIPISKNWTVPGTKFKKPIGMGRLGFEILDWIDALVQAVFMVLLIQIFIVQLYVIPSESMVPTFLIKDRVAVTKINCGPKFPLTDVGLPDFTKYNRGDIVVLRNPHYKMDRKSEVKSVTSQLVYMLTFMGVNLNTDENGQPKADPLVKRITGVPGEQLVMQDGVLYSRRKNDDTFKPVTEDNKHACWNLNAVSNKLKPSIEYFPFDNDGYNTMLDFEETRRNYDLNVASFQAQELVRKFNSLAYKDNLMGVFAKTELDEETMFTRTQDLTMQLMSQEGGVQWFENFMTSWIPKKNNSRDMYAESNYRLNVMSKIVFGKMVVRYAEMIRDGVSASQWLKDSEIISYLNEASLLHWYIRVLLDSRNMPVFPANSEDGNPNYIPDNCYFMMGDNRFNSLDLRHANDYSMKALCVDDSNPVYYSSIIDQKYVHKKLILGKPIFRFWPTNRPMKIS